jgi:SOS-response transcriptional repressor LexA
VVLNVAGSRGSQAPQLQEDVKNIIAEVITQVNHIDVVETCADDTEKMIELPFYPELKIACGAFRDGIGEYEKETMKVANLHINLDPERHFIVRANGDSMDGGNNPIKDGDLLLFELNEGGTISNQIFAVEYQDDFGETAYVLKRIVKDATGKYMLVSRNKTYPPIQVDPETMFPFARFKYKL